MTMLVRQDGKNSYLQHVDVGLTHKVYLAIASLAIANRTTKSEFISHVLESSPMIEKEMQAMEAEPESIFALSRETVEESSKS